MTALWRPPLQEAAEKLEQGSSPERREIFRAPAGLAFPCPGWAAQGAGGHRDQLPSPLSWGMAGHRWHRGTHSARAEHRNPAPGLDGRFETGCGDGAERHQLPEFTEMGGTGGPQGHMWGGEGERSCFPSPSLLEALQPSTSSPCSGSLEETQPCQHDPGCGWAREEAFPSHKMAVEVGSGTWSWDKPSL